MDISSPGYRFWTYYQAEGNTARIYGHWEREQLDALIVRNTEFTLRFWSHGGVVTVGTKAHTRAPRAMARVIQPQITNMPASPVGTVVNNRISLARIDDSSWHDPWDEWGVHDNPPVGPVNPPQPPGGGGGGVGHAPVLVKLYAPGLADPVQTWDLPEGIAGTVRTVKYDPPGFPSADAPIKRAGWWRCTVTPTGPDPVEIYISADSTFAMQPFHTQSIGTRLFNSAFRVALEALVPVVYMEGHTLKISMGKELAEAYGLTPVFVSKDVSPASSNAKLRSLNITAVSGRVLKDVANQRHRHPAQLAQVQDDDVVLRIQAAFDKASVTAYGFDVARLKGELGELFLAFDKSFMRCTPVSFIAVKFSTLADWLIDIASLFSEVNHDIVNTTIETELAKFEKPLRTYLQEALSRAVAQRAVVDRVSASAGSWQLRYYIDPEMPNENITWHPPFGGGAGGGLHVGGNAVDTMSMPVDGTPATPGSGGGTPTQPSTPSTPAPSTDPLGVFPPDFVVAGGAALNRLDRHQSIIVIMMENRSYDHLLGGLATARPQPGVGYDGPPANAHNLSAEGFAGTIPVVKTTAINMSTATPVCPHHDFAPVQFQIGDGTADTLETGGMQGFTRSVADRTDAPQIVMMQYQESQLPTYYRLADEFMVCARWFAAHPGPTWPNRYATVTGSIPALDNFPSDDPRIGFLQGHTIYDALTNAGIEWRVFESDFSLIRTFDRYRLDDRRVVPIDDPNDGLETVLRKPGPLPRVMFVEPNFTDLPPLATACDDLAPTDLAHGQAFIARICDWIWASNRFDQCMLVITYDEHGGFYDHVPPPGTPKSDLAPVHSFPKLHPDGPQHLGVRVPAFIVSPFVSAHGISYQVFDHTSILKTILVHNRDRFPTSVFESFGPRVAQAAHLGAALDLDSPRPKPLPFATLHTSTPQPHPGHLGGLLNDIAVLPTTAVATTGTPAVPAMGPPLPRTITFVPASGLEGTELGDPKDFHVALRDALRPRR